MRQDSYETIMRTIGRMLDQAEPQNFSVTSSDAGLVVEAFDAAGERRLAVDLSVAELVQLTDWVGATADTPHYERASASDEGTLQHFLQQKTQRELVGAR